MVHVLFHCAGEAPVICICAPVVRLGIGVEVVNVANVSWNVPLLPGPVFPPLLLYSWKLEVVVVNVK